MGLWRAITVLLLVGCPLPEDEFVLSGTVMDAFDQPRADVEVRLLRNQFPSEIRCDALELLKTTRTNDEGAYTFRLLRQQITVGVMARRFFRVETDQNERVVSQTFWFPDADLPLGELRAVQTNDDWRVNEVRADERLAWRSELGEVGFAPERAFSKRTSWSLREWRTVPIDSLGRYDLVPVDWALESPWQAQEPNFNTSPPQSRGAACPQFDVTPCPLTDGRFLPYFFPPDARTLVLDFGREVSVSPLLLHGLVLQRPAVSVRLEFNFVLDFNSWNPLVNIRLDGRRQERSAERCTEPGSFVVLNPPAFIKPRLLRIAFEDETGALVPIVSLAEVSTN